MKKNKKKFLLSCLILVITIVCTEFYLYTTNSYKHTKRRVESTIATFENESKTFANKFFKNANDDYFSYINENSFSDFATYLIYTNSSLTFWSNNVSNYPALLSPLFDEPIYHTNNSINYCNIYKKDTIALVIMLPLKNTYPIENQYVNNDISSIFKISNNYDFVFSETITTGNCSATDSYGNCLFSVKNDDKCCTKFHISNFSSVLFIIFACLCVCYVLFLSNFLERLNGNKKFFRGLIMALGLRLLFKTIYLLHFFHSVVFSKQIGISFLLDSPGDIFISSFYLLIIIIFYFNCHRNSDNKTRKPIISFLFHFTFTILSILCFIAIYKLFIISNSESIFLQFTKINIFSVLIFLSILLIATTIAIIVSNLIFQLLKSENNKTLSPTILSIICIIAVALTIFYNQSNNRREEINAKLIAKDNIFVRNPLVEQTFTWVFSEFGKDSTINNLLMSNLIPNASSMHLNNIISSSFNHGYLSKYYVKYIIADSATTINIDNDTNIYNCNEYFHWFIDNYGTETSDNNLTYIKNLGDVPYYIYHLKIKNYDIWFDVIPKYNLEGIGYSELVSTPESQLYSINLSKYSIAIYVDNYLIRSIGKFSYNNNLDIDAHNITNESYFTEHGYKHYVFDYTAEDEIIIIISKSYNLFNRTISPFSLFFISLLVFYFLSGFLMKLFLHEKLVNSLSLKQKIQNFSIVFFIIISLIIGIFSIFLVVSLNNNKNKNILTEKTHSLCKELEFYISNLDNPSDFAFGDILTDLSAVHFVDINVYDRSGFLIGTSNEEIFLNNISSSLINSVAFDKLAHNNRFLHEEYIGSYSFLSSYMVFSDINDEIYFLNIPYFSKRADLKNEITNYIVSFINLYLIIIVFAIVMTYLLSKFITRPLGMLKDKLSALSLQKENEKIDYIQDDEIGKLVEVYNLKVDELEKSVNLLSKSERESAWREMAQQVAHEIKNPLTPMKLSTQYIYKLWKDNSLTFGEQIEKYKETMITQIDSLSEIASAFSNFAKMPEAKNEKLNICYTLQQTVVFYKQVDVNILLHNDNSDIFIHADQNLITRVFHNLIRNSIEAYKNKQGNKDLLMIEISVVIDNSLVLIEIKDNGPGISGEMEDKIFLPNFTTKSGGTGLGLAIVRNIIENTGGTIINVKCDNGAVFQIVLPLLT